MNTICVTGLSSPDVGRTLDVLGRAGLQPARPAADGLDIGTWHARLARNMNALEPVAAPGRVWEQLAGGIVMANLEAPLWGWGDVRSAMLLDFWQNFDPGIRFVCVAASPVHMVAAALADRREPWRVDEVLAGWRAVTLELLRFCLRHPGQALLVDAVDCAAHPDALVGLCASRWNMPLRPAAAPAAAPAPLPPVALYLAERLCTDRPGLAEIAADLEMAVTPLGPGTAAAPAPDAVVAGYQALRDACGDLGDVDAVARRLDDLTAERDSWRERAREGRQQLDAAGADRETLADRVRSLEAALARHDDMATRLAAVSRENELYRLQLEQVRGELDACFARYLRERDGLAAAAGRWERLLACQPDYCDIRELEISLTADAEGPGLDWRCAGLELAGRTLADAAGGVRLEDGVARFTGEAATIPAAPTRAENAPARLAALLELPAWDWAFARNLARRLRQALDTPPEGPDGAAVALADGLDRFLATLEAMPAGLRYDAVSLVREQRNPDYEHVWLRLDGVSLGAGSWPAVEFRLSSAQGAGQAFGAFPKLEFPRPEGKGPLAGWFEESSDPFGPKLELRFALPGEMDREVWARLGEGDRYFIAALAARLPVMLAALDEAGVETDRPLEDWLPVVAALQRILQAAWVR